MQDESVLTVENAPALTACHECDLLVRETSGQESSPHYSALCPRCGTLLYRHSRHSQENTLALACACLVLLAVANAFPVVGLNIQGQRIDTTVIGAAIRLWQYDMPAMSLLVLATTTLDPGKSSSTNDRFVGLESPPLVVGDMPGRQFVLSAADLGSLDIGAPVYYRHIPVGRVVAYALRQDGQGVDVRVFVDAPYDRFVTAATRFWHASGIDLSVGVDGMKLEMQSLLSLVAGGVAFAGGDASAVEAPVESRFTLFADQTTAFRQPDSIVQKYVLVFNESVRGLTVGAPVDFRGLSVGEVSRIDVDVNRGTGDVAMVVEISLYLERFARQERNRPSIPPTAQAIRQVLNAMVAKGFRAQLRTGNLLTSQLYVALDFFPKSKAAAIRWGGQVPELPTQPGSLNSLQEQLPVVVEALQGTLQRAARLIAHIDQEVVPELAPTLRDARQTLLRTDRLMSHIDQDVVPELAPILRDARQTLARANAVLSSDAPVQTELRDTLREVGRAATAVRNLADMLEQQPQALLTGKKASQ